MQYAQRWEALNWDSLLLVLIRVQSNEKSSVKAIALEFLLSPPPLSIYFKSQVGIAKADEGILTFVLPAVRATAQPQCLADVVSQLQLPKPHFPWLWISAMGWHHWAELAGASPETDLEDQGWNFVLDFCWREIPQRNTQVLVWWVVVAPSESMAMVWKEQSFA